MAWLSLLSPEYKSSRSSSTVVIANLLIILINPYLGTRKRVLRDQNMLMGSAVKNQETPLNIPRTDTLIGEVAANHAAFCLENYDCNEHYAPPMSLNTISTTLFFASRAA